MKRPSVFDAYPFGLLGIMAGRRAAWVLGVILTVVGPSLGRAQTTCTDAPGISRARCELEAVLAAPLCDPIDARLASAVARRLEGARRLLEQAGATTSARRQARLVRRAGKKLGGVPRRTERAERRMLISNACRAAIDQRVAVVQDALAATPTVTPLPGLPDYTAGFDRWFRLNANPIPRGGAHGGAKNVYVNRTRDQFAPDGAQRFPYPEGSIVVKAALSPGGDFINLVAIMRKRAGSDPANGDWTFIEFSRASASGQFTLLARDGACWGCHADARAMDRVFTPLE